MTFSQQRSGLGRTLAVSEEDERLRCNRHPICHLVYLIYFEQLPINVTSYFPILKSVVSMAEYVPYALSVWVRPRDYKDRKDYPQTRFIAAVY